VPPAAGSQHCILVVDDDPRSLKLMSIVLGRAGYRVETAGNSVTGIDRLRSLRPDLVLVDLLMPVVDGLEFCRRARALEAGRAVALVLFTAMASTEVNRQALDAGADAMLLKPFDRNEFLRDIAELLDRAGVAPGDGCIDHGG